jgi:3-hydroxyisobutyrate dehydrogenase-like beta-hydroxyacid dehydrogenase
MAKLAFCGLGAMGSPMAGRLVEAGHDLTVWNRTRAKGAPLVEKGARQAATPAEAATAAEAAITMVASPEALDEVVFGGAGLAEGLIPGATLIEMSTVGPATIHRVAERMPPRIDLIDAPVLGTIPQARDGILKIFAGGSEEACARWLPVLQALGTPRRVGSLGSGAAMKVVVNSTLLALMTALGEALAVADATGLHEQVVLDVLSDSPIGITARSKRDNVASGRYQPNFRLALAGKDARLVSETAGTAGLRLPVAEAARGWLERAGEAGLGDLDYSAVIAYVRGRPASS